MIRINYKCINLESFIEENLSDIIKEKKEKFLKMNNLKKMYSTNKELKNEYELALNDYEMIVSKFSLEAEVVKHYYNFYNATKALLDKALKLEDEIIEKEIISLIIFELKNAIHQFDDLGILPDDVKLDNELIDIWQSFGHNIEEDFSKIKIKNGIIEELLFEVIKLFWHK